MFLHWPLEHQTCILVEHLVSVSWFPYSVEMDLKLSETGCLNPQKGWGHPSGSLGVWKKSPKGICPPPRHLTFNASFYLSALASPHQKQGLFVNLSHSASL